MQSKRPVNNRRVLAEGKFLRMVAANGWEWVERINTSGAVVVAPVTARGEIVLVEQYRVPLGARVVELPAGLSGDLPGTEHEAMIEAARRELYEETGFESARWEFLLEGPSSAGLATETYSLFLARDAHRTGQGGGDEKEDIEVHTVPLARIRDWLQEKVREGAVVDPKIYAALYFATK